jgi:hypothetical protein
LLADDLPPAEQVDLNGHLELCPACQRTLEECAANQDVWAAARTLGALTQSRSHVLDDVIDGLKLDPESDHAHHDGAELPVDFLDPPGDFQIREGEAPAEPRNQPARQESHPPTNAQPDGSLGRIHQYDVLEEIGRGGMGVVLKALDPGLHRVVAIKVLAPQLAVSGTARKRFTREARAAAAIGHENVVTIHAVEEFKGLPYLVMQYIAGPSVQQRIAADGPLPVADILRIGFQTAAGLAAAHAQGLIHRDVKPANILLENGVERVKLTDFSLARAIDDASVTQSGVVTGTPPFMAPEQARGEPLDHRADLFSLGSVLYAMCTGRPPFRGGSLDVLRKVSEEQPVSIRILNPEIPTWLEAIVNKLMAKNPDGRYQSAGEVAALLERCLAHVQQPTVVPLPAALARGVHVSRVKHKRLVAIAAGLFAVMLAGAVVVKVKTANGTLEVTVDDPGATVTVDGTDVVVSGMQGVKEFRLKAGDYTVHQTKDGKPEKTEVVSIKTGEKTPLRVTFEADGRTVAARDADLEQMLLQLHWEKRRLDELMGPNHPRLKEVNDRIAEVRKLLDQRAPDAKEIEHARAQLERAQAEAEKAKADLAVANAFLSQQLARTQPAAGQPVTQSQRSFKTDAHEVSSAVFSPDGTQLFVADWSGNLYGQDLATGNTWFTIAASKYGLQRFLAVSPDGATLASVGTEQRIHLWDLKTAKLRHQLQGHADPCYAVAFSLDGKTLAAGGCVPQRSGGILELWDLESGRVRTVEFPDAIRSLAFPPAVEDRIAVGTMGEAVRMIYPSTAKQEYSLGQSGPIRALAFSPDGKLMAASSGDGHVHLWDWQWGRDAANHRGEATLIGHAGRVNTIQFSPDGKWLATASVDGTAKLWDVRTYRCVATFTPGKYKTGMGVAVFSPDGKSLVTAGDDGMIRIWDLTSLKAAAGVPVLSDIPHVGNLFKYTTPPRPLADPTDPNTARARQADLDRKREMTAPASHANQCMVCHKMSLPEDHGHRQPSCYPKGKPDATEQPGTSSEATRPTNEREKPMKTLVYGLLGLGLAAPPALAGENILLNPSFEDGKDSPAHWSQGADIDGVEYVWDKHQAYQGKASLCLHKTAKRYFPIAQWYQVVDRTGDKQNLKVSAQVKADGVTKAILDVGFLDDKGEWVSHQWAAYVGAKQANDPAVTHDWKEYAGAVQIPKEAKKLQICLQIYGPGKVWFDDVRAEYAD